MTSPKRWPKNANYARTESLAQAKAILKQVSPLMQMLENKQAVNHFELALRLGRINDAAHKIIHELTVTAPLEFKKEP